MDRFRPDFPGRDLELLREMQRDYAERVVEAPLPEIPGIVGAVDVHLSGNMGVAVVVTMSTPDLDVVETRSAEGEIDFPYIPGFLSFREAPLCIEAIRNLEREPDLLLVDGHGRAHPLQCGLACHTGVELGIPTVGVAKSRLIGHFDEPGQEKGNRTELVHRGRLIGNVVRTRDGVRPVFVSVGNLVRLEEAVNWTLELARRYRLPEPSHLAHKLAREQARSMSSEGRRS